MAKPIRVVIASGDAQVTELAQTALAPVREVRVVGAVDSGQATSTTLKEGQTDIVVVTAALTDMRGVKLIAALRQRQPTVRLLGLSMQFADDLEAMLEAGARGYIIAGPQGEGIMEAVLALRSPTSRVGVHIADMTTGQSRIVRLTRRQYDVLRLMAQAKSNYVIGVMLGVTERNVEQHLTQVYRLLGVDGRMAAGFWAREYRLT